MDFIFDPSLVLYLPLYELGGASFMSKDAYGHTCTVTGALWGPNGRVLDGDDYITVPHHSAFNFDLSSAWTVMGWLKTSQSDSRAIMYKRASDGDFQGFNILLSGNNLDVGLRTDVDNTRNLNGAIAINTGAWVHYAWVHPANSQETADNYVYIDAVLDTLSERTKSGTITTLTNTEDLHIGATESHTIPWIGSLGKQWLYNRALTPQEIQNIYLATKWRYR